MSNTRLVPKISYCNFRKAYPNAGRCFTNWFSVERYWGGKIVSITVKHHAITLDFRRDWLADMTPEKQR